MVKLRYILLTLIFLSSIGSAFAQTSGGLTASPQFVHIPIRAFVCLSNNVCAAQASTIQSHLDYASQIFGQVGIVFDLVSISNLVNRAADWDLAEIDSRTNSAGQVQRILSRQSRDLMNIYTGRDCIELYYVGRIVQGRALAFSTPFGIVISQKASRHIVAHEIGHRFGLKDCYDIRVLKTSGFRTIVKIPGYDTPVTRETSPGGSGDWGRETGRGFYSRADTRSAILRRLLMYGYDGQDGVDIPDGGVLSLTKNARSSADIFTAPVGASNFEPSMERVFTK